jgi:hypothetical protein
VKSSQPVLVEFATEWSLLSMVLDGALDEIAAEFVDRLKVAHVKLDRNLTSDCGTAFDASRQCCTSSTVSQHWGIFGTTRKDAILSQLKPVISSRRIPAF